MQLSNQGARGSNLATVIANFLDMLKSVKPLHQPIVQHRSELRVRIHVEEEDNSVSF